MAATIRRIDGISEAYRDILSVYIPFSGSVNDMKIAYDHSVLGNLLTITDGGPGIWGLSFANNVPAESNLIITTGGNLVGALHANDDMLSITVDFTFDAKTFTIQTWTDHGGTPHAIDTTAWVKVQMASF